MTSPTPASPPRPAPAPFRPFSVATPDGLTLAARRHGAETGQGLIFVHGFSQSGLCWTRQTRSPDLAHLPMVDYDFRGHGGSDKPLEDGAYKDPGRWAGEVAAVIARSGLVRPILVGWSYAGRIISDYLAHSGGGALGGIVFVDAVISNERAFFGTCNKLMRQMCSPDMVENIDATRAFLRRCVAAPMEAETFEIWLAANMMVPAEVRRALFGRPADYEALLAALDLPVLVVQGGRDEVVAPAMAHHIAATIPGAELLLMEDAGHAPFFEDTPRFNAALAGFAARVSGRPPAP